jgi:hypothetical protein
MGKRLHRLLHSAYLDVWAAFAAEVGGRWNTPAYGEDARIEVPHPAGPIVIETDVTMVMVGKVMVPVYSTTFTAMRPSLPAHRFSVSRASFATSVAQWFGALDIQVDDPTFDQAFVLKGDTPDVVRSLFADAALRTQYLDAFEGSLALKDDTAFFSDPTPGQDPLEITVSGIIEEPHRLRRLHALLAATLTRLAALGG